MTVARASCSSFLAAARYRLHHQTTCCPCHPSGCAGCHLQALARAWATYRGQTTSLSSSGQSVDAISRSTPPFSTHSTRLPALQPTINHLRTRGGEGHWRRHLTRHGVRTPPTTQLISPTPSSCITTATRLCRVRLTMMASLTISTSWGARLRWPERQDATALTMRCGERFLVLLQTVQV